MRSFKESGVLLACFILCMVDSRGIAGNVKLVAMNGNQYWFSSSSPYAPSLNFHLAYQYCRTLGLQLAVLETKEEVETISAYLNSGDGSQLNQNKYWTSGNKLGADSWIWMSSGEQLNSSFSDYWLKNGIISPSSAENARHCMSMKAPITKRAIFTAEECGKSLPFICEQVRCLYYNYPVMMFPDPADLRADIEDGTAATPPESESRTINNYSPSPKNQNDISGSGRNILLHSQNKKPSSLSDITAEESGRIDPTKIQRRITLRPIMSNFPYPPSYINSFYKYKSVDYTSNSTKRPSFKKTTRETLWGTSNTNQLNPGSTTPSDLGNNSGTLQPVYKIEKASQSTRGKSTVYVTGKVLRPSNSTVATSIESSVTEKKSPTTYTHLEIVTSKSTSIDGEEVADDVETPTTIYERYGAGSTESYQVLGHNYVSTNPTVMFDDEQNNVGGEVEVDDTTIVPAERVTRFFQGNGIRRPDTTSGLGVTDSTQGDDNEMTTTLSSGNREASQSHSPATMKLYQFQRSKSTINWPRSGRSSVTVIANTSAGPSKIGLGPRLKFRTRN